MDKGEQVKRCVCCAALAISYIIHAFLCDRVEALLLKYLTMRETIFALSSGFKNDPTTFIPHFSFRGILLVSVPIHIRGVLKFLKYLLIRSKMVCFFILMSAMTRSGLFLEIIASVSTKEMGLL